MSFEDKQSDLKKDVIAILAIILFGVLSTLLLIRQWPRALIRRNPKPRKVIPWISGYDYAYI